MGPSAEVKVRHSRTLSYLGLPAVVCYREGRVNSRVDSDTTDCRVAMHAPFKYIDVKISPTTDGCDEVKQQLVAVLRPDWEDNEIVCEEITGGYINTTIRCHQLGDSELEDALMVRCYRDDLLPGWMSHDHELMGMQLAAHAGCFPPVLATFQNGLVYRYAPGRNLEGDDFVNPSIARSIARCLASLHSLDPAMTPVFNKLAEPDTFPHTFSFFQKVYEQLDNIPNAANNPDVGERIVRLLPEVDVLRKEFQSIEECFDRLSLSRGLCHMDVHGRNMIYNDKTADFPHVKEPVSDEIRLIYVTSYLERIYELRGLDPAQVTEREIQAKMLEIKLLDIISPILLLVVETCVIDADTAIFKIWGPLTQLYRERRAQLDSLSADFSRLTET